MLKTVKKLVNSKEDKCSGNHEVLTWDKIARWCIYHEQSEVTADVAVTRVFRYHENTICAVNDVNKVFFLSHAGWYTSSTNRALASYREYFISIGYKNVWNIPVYKYERNNGRNK